MVAILTPTSYSSHTMSMKHIHTLALFLFALWPLSAQTIEKSYISTDKNIYAPEDTIWFKTFVVGIDNQLSDRSLAYHVLLADSLGNKKADTSWPVYNGMSDGYLIAPAEEGLYTLMGVSGQMVGSDSSLYFSKSVFVRSIEPDAYKLLAFPRYSRFSKDAANPVDVYARIDNDKPVAQLNLTYRALANGVTVESGKIKTDTTGAARVFLGSSKKSIPTPSHLWIQVDEASLSKPVHLYVPLPAEHEEKIDLQFFPEGGHLIANTINHIAFKAIDRTGHPFDFEGYLKDETGTILDTLKSTHAGMGSFELMPELHKEYSVVIANSPQPEEIYYLPESHLTGIALHLKRQNNDRVLAIKPSQNLMNTKGFLTLSNQTDTIMHLDFTLQENLAWRVPEQNLIAGIYKVTVQSKTLELVAERLIFVNAKRKLNIDLQLDKKDYSPRQKVELTLTVKDETGAPVKGNFALAVTDQEFSKAPNNQQPHLLSQLLLTAELRGNIPTPNFYFSGQPGASEALDLVMLTHGWRKYSPSRYKDPEAIVGQSLSFIGNNPITGVEILIATKYSEKPDTVHSGESGRFIVESSFFKSKGDSVLLFLAGQEKGKRKVQLVSDTERRKALIGSLIRGIGHEKNSYAPLEIYKPQFKVAKSRFNNSTLLSTFKVKSSTVIPRGSCNVEDFHTQFPWKTKTIEELDLSDNDIIELIKQVSNEVEGIGATKLNLDYSDPFSGSRIPINDVLKSKKWPHVFSIKVNCDPRGMQAVGKRTVREPIGRGQVEVPRGGAYETLYTIDWSNLESISVSYPAPSSLILGHGDDGKPNELSFPEVILRTKNGVVIPKPAINDRIVHPVHRNYTKEFYSPLYETDEQKNDPVPDLRTTIYWNANVVTNENGQAKITFYNADRPNPIQVTVEGIGAYSRLGYSSINYQVIESNQ